MFVILHTQSGTYAKEFNPKTDRTELFDHLDELTLSGDIVICVDELDSLDSAFSPVSFDSYDVTVVEDDD